MTRFEALVSLNLIGDIGSIRLKKLLDYFGKPENIFANLSSKPTAILGMGQKIAARVRSFKQGDLEKELSLVKKYNLKILTIEDEEYPQNLKQIPDAPIVLYVKGEFCKEDKLALAIVGSRRASLYGLSSAEKFAYALAERGFTIVSGMAQGIDTRAHLGALKIKGRTIAVMGSGFAHTYPHSNKELVERISSQGVVVSEFPINMRPLRQNFPRRNRVISGLSLGVLVVEAARNSGALITADFALEQGREVFALPGKVDAENSFGTNGLIKQGAKLVSSTDDIIEELRLPILYTGPKIAPKESKIKLNLTEKELILYKLINHQPVALDEIIEKADMAISGLSPILLSLEMKKLIRQLPGKQFVRSADET